MDVEIPTGMIMERIGRDGLEVGISRDEFIRAVWCWLQIAFEDVQDKEWMVRDFMRLHNEVEIIEGD